MENIYIYIFFPYRILKSFYGFTGRDVIPHQMSGAALKCLYLKNLIFLLWSGTEFPSFQREENNPAQINSGKPPRGMLFIFSEKVLQIEEN